MYLGHLKEKARMMKAHFEHKAETLIEIHFFFCKIRVIICFRSVTSTFRLSISLVGGAMRVQSGFSILDLDLVLVGLWTLEIF